LFFSKAPLIDNERFLKAVTLGLDANFNRNDILAGLSLGLQTTKRNFSLYAGYNIRPKAKTVYVENGFNTFYKYNEGRSFAYINLEKRFGYEVLFSQIGVLVGVKYTYSFGKYRGTNISYDPLHIYMPFYLKEDGEKHFIPPVVGIFWMNPDAIFKITYEYVDLQMPDQPEYTSVQFPSISNHRICVSFVYCFNFSLDVGF